MSWLSKKSNGKRADGHRGQGDGNGLTRSEGSQPRTRKEFVEFEAVEDGEVMRVYGYREVPSPQSMVDFARDACADLASKRSRNFFDDKKARKDLGIEASEEVFLMRGEFVGFPAKRFGFAITEKGLYCRVTPFDEVTKVPWDLFVSDYCEPEPRFYVYRYPEGEFEGMSFDDENTQSVQIGDYAYGLVVSICTADPDANPGLREDILALYKKLARHAAALREKG